jgi:hypothetical protein
MNTEPVRLVSLINTALGLTIGLLAILFKWAPELTGALTAVFAAWVGVAGELMRSRVSPVPPAP